jgi:hypothetical protein
LAFLSVQLSGLRTIHQGVTRALSADDPGDIERRFSARKTSTTTPAAIDLNRAPNHARFFSVTAGRALGDAEEAMF